MACRGVSAAVVLSILLPALPASAEKIPPEFRSAFEGKVRANFTYGVVVKKGVPTTSIYGIKGDQTSAFYSVDVKGGVRGPEDLSRTLEYVEDYVKLSSRRRPGEPTPTSPCCSRTAG